MNDQSAANRHSFIPAWVDGHLLPVDKLEVHRKGLRHPAVSVFLMDGDRTLLQRRALGKYHTPGLWANACCTHPRWGEPTEACASRRLLEELGIVGLPLARSGRVSYSADVGQGMVEREDVDLFIGNWRPAVTLAPDPSEVMETRWIPLPQLEYEIAQTPERFTPWLRIYLAEHAGTIFGPVD